MLRVHLIVSIVSGKSQDPNSPYSQLMQNMATSFEHLMEVGSSNVVAKVVLKAVTTENPSLKYLAGKDVEGWIEGKKSMSDGEFHKMIKQNMMK